MSILKPNFTYIDLFSGIGGFRWAMQNYSKGKARCLYASEIDPFAARVYENNFGQKPFGDIRKLDPITMNCPPPMWCVAGFHAKHFLKAALSRASKILVELCFERFCGLLNPIRKSPDRN